MWYRLGFAHGEVVVSRRDDGHVLVEVTRRDGVTVSLFLARDEAFDLSTHLLALWSGEGARPGRRLSKDHPEG